MSTELVVQPAPIWRLHVDDADGEVGRRFSATGKVEIWITAIPLRRVREDGHVELVPAGQQSTFLALEVDTWEQAHAVAPALVTLCENANKIFQHVRELVEGTPKHELLDGHRHKIRLERFSRVLPWSATCELCMETLTEDGRALLVDPEVVEHARMAGINDDGGFTQTGVKVLESWFNGPGRPRP